MMKNVRANANHTGRVKLMQKSKTTRETRKREREKGVTTQRGTKKPMKRHQHVIKELEELKSY